MKDSYRNPFDGINASQLKDKAILDYWCNPFSYKLFSNLKEEDIFVGQLNTIIVGGRSSGKTMLLRYASFNVQYQKAVSEINNDETIIKYFIDKGGIGIYKRIDGSALNDFNNKNIPEEKRNGLFTHYFELNICYEYLEAISTLHKGNHIKIDKRLISELSELLGNPSVQTIQACLTHLDKEIKKVDDYRSRLPFYENLELDTEKIFAATTLVYNVPEIISKYIKEFKKLNFVILIDEYENFASSQQRMINTLLKFTKPNIKFRISMRPEGFNTRHTVSDSDVIEEGREFKEINFDNATLKDTDYDKFITDVCEKRLSNVKVFRDSNKTDIISFLGLRENLEEEALAVTKKHLGRHFQLKKYNSISKAELNKLRYPGNPLLEMLNLLWLTRGVSVKDISTAMHNYLSEKSDSKTKTTALSKKYKMDYVDKYKLSLMFLLASIYRKTKMYYSFRTFSFLSFGMVGHFLELCNEAFKYAAFEDKQKLINEGMISKDAQNKAAYEVAFYHLKKTASTPDYGNEIYQFINNIGNIFQSFHLDSQIKYPETNQFSVDYLLVKDSKYKEAFRHAIRWSAIRKKKSKQRPSASKNKADIYTINRIFAPVFGITYRTRGGYSYELTPDELVKYMTEKIEPSKEFQLRSKRKISVKPVNGQTSTRQTTLF
jgi:hypothetical protein